MAGSPELQNKTPEERVDSLSKNENTIFCSKCGARYNANLKKCPYCGEKNLKKKNNNHKTLFIILISLFGFILFINAIGGSSSDSENSSSEESEAQKIEVVDFSSMSQDEINSWGSENGITIDIEEEYSNDVAEGNLISQSISAGDNIKQGKTIKVVYSKGVEPSQEYKNALKKAQSYSDMMHMSKKRLYKQLTSEYGEQFPDDAAQYAIDHVDADWNANALATAKTYYEDMNMSKQRVYEQLTSSYGEEFTESEAQYAIDHLDD